MPEFILDKSGRVQIDGAPFQGASLSWDNLDPFVQGYIEAMFFTCTGTGDDAENNLEDASFDELAPKTLAKIIADCVAFQEANADHLAQAYGMQGKYEKQPYDPERAGNDYWYTRNGHGTGFWDRGLGTVGDRLANAARYSEKYLYRGDDGLLYLD